MANKRCPILMFNKKPLTLGPKNVLFTARQKYSKCRTTSKGISDGDIYQILESVQDAPSRCITEEILKLGFHSRPHLPDESLELCMNGLNRVQCL